jgi:hypothetical protein
MVEEWRVASTAPGGEPSGEILGPNVGDEKGEVLKSDVGEQKGEILKSNVGDQKGEVLKSNVGEQEGGVLRSNVGEMPSEAPTRRGGPGLLPIVLGVVLVFLVGAAAALLLVSFASQSRSQPAAASGATARATNTLVPVAGVRGTSASAAALPDVNGISCDALESTVVHNHVHLAIFVNGQEEQIPLGIGIGQPWQVSDSDEGPFVEDGSCFYWIHTHTEDGIVHIESPVRRRFTLADFFAIWQMPLNENQVGPAQGPVITYVNGQRSSTPPQDIPLLPHARIQLDIGGDVPPYPFDFPDGD